MYSALQLSVEKYNDHKYFLSFFNFLINVSGLISFIFIGWQMFAKIWMCGFYTFSLISVLLTLRYIVKYIVLLIIQYDLPPFLNFKLPVRSTWMRTLSYFKWNELWTNLFLSIYRLEWGIKLCVNININEKYV